MAKPVKKLHKCPHPDCGKTVPAERFGCREHWFQLPKSIRDAVWTGYRSADRSDHGKAMMSAMRYWRDKASNCGGECR